MRSTCASAATFYGSAPLSASNSAPTAGCSSKRDRRLNVPASVLIPLHDSKGTGSAGGIAPTHDSSWFAPRCRHAGGTLATPACLRRGASASGSNASVKALGSRRQRKSRRRSHSRCRSRPAARHRQGAPRPRDPQRYPARLGAIEKRLPEITAQSWGRPRPRAASRRRAAVGDVDGIAAQ